MKRILMAAMIAVCVGCGGGGSSVNPFAGTWNAEVSTGTLSVANNGHFTASIDDTAIGGVDSYVGTIHSSGDLEATMTNSTAPGVIIDITGTVTRSNADEIVVHLVASDGAGHTSSASESFSKQRGVSRAGAAKGLSALLEKLKP